MPRLLSGTKVPLRKEERTKGKACPAFQDPTPRPHLTGPEGALSLSSHQSPSPAPKINSWADPAPPLMQLVTSAPTHPGPQAGVATSVRSAELGQLAFLPHTPGLPRNPCCAWHCAGMLHTHHLI